MKALVLSGGGSRGAYQVGVLKHLLGDLHTQYDMICGISVGSINAAGLAMFPHGQEKECIQWIEDLWRNLKTSDIYQYWLNLPGPAKYVGYLFSLWKPSVYDSTPLKKLIYKYYDSEKIKKSGKKLRIGAVSLSSGEYKTFTENSEFMIEAILGSSAFPGAFLPIKIENELYLDGGIKEICNLNQAFKEGAFSIDVIICGPEKEPADFGKDINIIKLGPRIIDLMSEEIVDNDLSRAIQINELILSGATIPGKRYVPLRIFRPEKKLSKSSLNFEQESIAPLIDKGYEDAIKIVKKYEKKIKA